MTCRAVEMLVTISLSCVPGLVACWRHVLRDTVVVKRLRVLVGSTKKATPPEPTPEEGNQFEEYKGSLHGGTIRLAEV